MRWLLMMAVVLTACGSDTTGGSGGSGGVGGEQATGAGGTGGGGDVTSCADCSTEQICITCNTAIRTTYGCVPRVSDTATQFACGEQVLCDLGTEVCVADTPAPGDTCGTSYDCNFFPSACDATPTCACITMYEPYQSATCTDLGDGKFVLETGF
jgi:hypothetical protein